MYAYRLGKYISCYSHCLKFMWACMCVGIRIYTANFKIMITVDFVQDLRRSKPGMII